MFRFSIREIMLLTLMAGLIGCKARSAVAPQSTALPAAKVAAAPQQITKERAIEIVRQDMAKNPPEVQCDYKATEKEDEYWVFVEMGSGRDENGRLTGQYPGSHCTYILSKQGKITVIHPGL